MSDLFEVDQAEMYSGERTSLSEWPEDMECDEGFEEWMKDGTGDPRYRCHEEAWGCVVLMRTEYGCWKYARRNFVWVEREFLMPVPK